MSNSDRYRPTWIKFAAGVVGFVLLLLIFDRGLIRLFLLAEPISFDVLNLEDKLGAIPDKAAYEVLLLGTSRTFNSIHPKYVNPVIGSKMYKEASVGKGPKYNLHFYRLYRKTMGVPKIVVYGVDYFTFNIHSQAKLLHRFPECGNVTMPADPGLSLLLANKERIDQFINAVLIQHRGAKIESRPSFSPEINVADMEAYTGSRVYDPSHVVTEIPANFEKIRAPFCPLPGKEGDDYMELLRELKEDHVNILLVTIPDHIGTFRTFRHYRRFIKEHRKALERLDYKGHCYLIDYDSPSRFPMSDVDCFINGGYGVTNSHLSDKGAKIFCAMFAKDLKDLLQSLKRGGPSSQGVKAGP